MFLRFANAKNTTGRSVIQLPFAALRRAIIYIWFIHFLSYPLLPLFKSLVFNYWMVERYLYTVGFSPHIDACRLVCLAFFSTSRMPPRVKKGTV